MNLSDDLLSVIRKEGKEEGREGGLSNRVLRELCSLHDCLPCMCFSLMGCFAESWGHGQPQKNWSQSQGQKRRPLAQGDNPELNGKSPEWICVLPHGVQHSQNSTVLGSEAVPTGSMSLSHSKASSFLICITGDWIFYHLSHTLSPFASQFFQIGSCAFPWAVIPPSPVPARVTVCITMPGLHCCLRVGDDWKEQALQSRKLSPSYLVPFVVIFLQSDPEVVFLARHLVWTHLSSPGYVILRLEQSRFY
jgi:hypothetical protein